MNLAVDKLPRMAVVSRTEQRGGGAGSLPLMVDRATGLCLRRAWLLLAAGAGLASCIPQSPRDAFSASGELIALSGGEAGAANACFTCHGLDGSGNGAGAPRLAGLGPGYLGRQLDDYASGRRRHPQMEYIARSLSSGERQAVAAFYADMPVHIRVDAAVRPHPLYTEGDPARGLASCASCHGADGEGVGAGNPPLAGQPSTYLAAQLHAWRSSERRNDPGNLMLDIARRLTEPEIKSLSAYAAALPGAASHRGFPAASREARRDGPRNGASAPPPRGAGPAR